MLIIGFSEFTQVRKKLSMPVNAWTQVVLKSITILMKKLCGNMKTIYDLIFCDATLSRHTVFYQVYVGKSARDLRALAFVRTIALAPEFFFTKHSLNVQGFIDKCAAEIFGYYGRDGAARFLRRKVVTITWLAAFLKRAPPCLLNSSKIQ